MSKQMGPSEEQCVVSPLPSILVTEGVTDAVRFVGRQGTKLRFVLRAHGRVIGEPGGAFRFEEYVSLSLARLRMSNWGLVTVDAPGGTFTVRFEGQAHGVRMAVSGKCWADGVSGRYAGATRSGTYEGLARLRFRVVYRFG